MSDQFKRGEAVPFFFDWVESRGSEMFITDDFAFDVRITGESSDSITVSACDLYGEPVASACVPFHLIEKLRYPIDVLCFVEESIDAALMDSLRRGGRTITITS